MLKAYQYRISPTKKQRKTLETHLEECRCFYNHLLEMRNTAYERDGISLSCFQQQRTYPVLKDERPALRDVHSQVLQQVAVRVDLAYKAFFRRCKTGEKPGFPRFKGYGRYDSITYPQSGFSITHDDRVCLSKIGTVKMVYHRPMKGTIKTCTIRRSSTDKWSVSFTVECEPERLEPCADTVGIDVGLKTFATLSDGQEIDNPRFFRNEEKALAKVQRKHATLAQGTKERRTHRKVIARVHERIAWRRENFTHQQSRKIVNQFGIICVEDLQVNRMVHNHCLSKSISDAAWSQSSDPRPDAKRSCEGSVGRWNTEYFEYLSRKAEEAGRAFLKVNPAYTFQDCSRCHHRQKMPLSVRTYHCPCCFLVIDRDLNASKNIVGLGLQSRVIPEAPCLQTGE